MPLHIDWKRGQHSALAGLTALLLGSLWAMGADAVRTGQARPLATSGQYAAIAQATPAPPAGQNADGALGVRTLTLRESVAVALSQNPDVLLAKMEARVSQARTTAVADPYSLKLSVGSGLAYTTGFPMNVGGSGPSIVNAQASMTLFDRAQRMRVQEARERGKASEWSEEEKRRAVALDVARAHLDAELRVQESEQLRREIESLERMAAMRRAEAAAGRALPLDVKQAAAQLARGRQRLREAESARQQAQALLGFLLGLDGGAQVSPAVEVRPPVALPGSPEDAAQRAVNDNPALAAIDRQLAASQWRLRAAKASHWPVIRLVSQYSMFSRFNNYDSFYSRFERHNGQIGASFELPLFTGKAPRAAAEEADAEQERLRLQAETMRRRLAMDATNRLRDRNDAWAAHELAALELDVARERVGVMLARSAEGRASLTDLETARVEEARRWADFYRSRSIASLRDLEVLAETGELLAYLQSF